MNALILMTRVPIPHKTKTRMIGPLTPEEVALLHQNFLKDIINTFSTLPNNIDIFLYHGQEGDASSIKTLCPNNMIFFEQPEGDLGKRQLHGFSYIFEKKYSHVILCGSDIPHITKDIILQGFDALQNSDVVFGPTFDGGYYLIGMNTLIKQVFSSFIQWGTAQTFSQSIQKSSTYNYKCSFVTKIQDIDTIEDLRSVYNSNILSKHSYTYNYIQEIKEKLL